MKRKERLDRLRLVVQFAHVTNTTLAKSYEALAKFVPEIAKCSLDELVASTSRIGCWMVGLSSALLSRF